MKRRFIIEGSVYNFTNLPTKVKKDRKRERVKGRREGGRESGAREVRTRKVECARMKQ